jgi:hypothetical protein
LVALQIGYALGLVVRVLAAKGLPASRNHLSKSKPA